MVDFSTKVVGGGIILGLGIYALKKITDNFPKIPELPNLPSVDLNLDPYLNTSSPYDDYSSLPGADVLTVDEIDEIINDNSAEIAEKEMAYAQLLSVESNIKQSISQYKAERAIWVTERNMAQNVIDRYQPRISGLVEELAEFNRVYLKMSTTTISALNRSAFIEKYRADPWYNVIKYYDDLEARHLWMREGESLGFVQAATIEKEILQNIQNAKILHQDVIDAEKQIPEYVTAVEKKSNAVQNITALNNQIAIAEQNLITIQPQIDAIIQAIESLGGSV